MVTEDEREPVGWLCTHGNVPETVKPGFQCVSGDEPVYPGDTVHTETRHFTVGELQTGTLRGIVQTHAYVEHAPGTRG